MSKRFTTQLDEDDFGDLVLTIPYDICQELGWDTESLLQYDVNEAESEYSDKYSDIESAVSNLEYISSELDSLYNAQRGVNNLLQSIEDAEMDKKATEETTEENTEQ